MLNFGSNKQRQKLSNCSQQFFYSTSPKGPFNKKVYSFVNVFKKLLKSNLFRCRYVCSTGLKSYLKAIYFDIGMSVVQV